MKLKLNKKKYLKTISCTLISLLKLNLENSIIKFLKEYIEPKQRYALYFQNQFIPEKFTNIVQNIFTNSSFKFLQCSKYLTEVSTTDEQNEKVKYHHIYKSGHRGITKVKFALVITGQYYLKM